MLYRMAFGRMVLGLALLGGAVPAADWPQFRGINSGGVGEETGLPVEFGPNRNVVWKTPLPAGHSSPVFSKDHIFLTAHDDEKLYAIALDRTNGRVAWRREVPRPRKQELHKFNSPASPSAVTDGKNAYVFFTDFGMMSFGPDGNERWRLPLGPFNNPFGMAASPVLSGNTLLQSCDSETGSFFVAVDKDSGKVKWRVERPEFTRGFSTPLVYRTPGGSAEVLVPGSGQLTAYSVETGEAVWWVHGLTWQLKPTPVMADGVIYVLGWAGGADTGQQENIPNFADVLKQFDGNKDGKLAKEEMASDPKLSAAFTEGDLDRDGFLGERDWRMFQVRRSSQNAIMAVKLGGRGDMTEKNILWRYYKSLPNAPSPLLYRGVIYLMKEGGIFTSLDAKTGAVLKQGRLMGALDQYFSSPVAGDGKIYVVSEAGHTSVIKAGGEWEHLKVNDMEEECFATPAIVDGKIYLRTHTALYAFGQKGAAGSGL